MSKLDLKIKLDQPGMRFVSGDVLTGHLSVRANKKVKCDELTLALKWETHGRGNVSSEAVEFLSLYSGEIPANHEERYPFEFVVPSGPYTYEGHYINVDWLLEARADIPWAIDPKDSIDLVIEPGEHATFDPLCWPSMGNSDTFQQGQDDVLLLISKVLLVIGLCFEAWGFRSGFDIEYMFCYMLGAFILFGALLVGFAPLRRRMAEKALGQVRCLIEPEVLAPGDEYTCSVYFVPQKDVRLLKAMTTLICEEVALSGSGTSQSTYTKRLAKETFLLPKEGQRATYSKNLPAQFSWTGRVPNEPIYSFESGSNDIRWMVKVHLDIRLSPDWIRDYSILVVPPAIRDAYVAQGEREKAEAEA